jgi:hypothetical protein
MVYVAGTMMAIFLLCSVALLGWAGKLLLQTAWRRPRLERAQGVVLRLERHSTMGRPSGRRHRRGHSRMRNDWRFFPVVGFDHQNGKPVSFTSSVGNTGFSSHYKVGQHLPVIYDPANAMPPMIDQGLSIWLMPVLMTFFGLVFLGIALTIWALVGDTILGL